MSSGLSIRPATRDDCETIADFNAGIARETEGLSLDRDRLVAGVNAILEDASKGRYYLACQGDEILGQAMVTREWSDWRNGDFWWFQSVYVRPEARTKGVFRALYRHIEAEAQQRKDVCGLRLYVDADNERAISVYGTLGMDRSNYLVMESDFRLER